MYLVICADFLIFAPSMKNIKSKNKINGNNG